MSYYHPNRKFLTLSPSDIKFTQDNIGMCFQNEQEVNNTCEEIVKGNLKVSDFPHIRVVYMEGNYFSVNNRRLYIFRVLNVLGSLNHIEVQKVQELNRELTTQNDGCHVILRRRKINNRWQERDTYRHCACFDGRNANLPRWWNANQKCHVSEMSVLLPNPVDNAKRFPTVYTINPPVNKNFKTNKVHLQHPSIPLEMSYYHPNHKFLTLSPSDIKFTQDTIGMCFQNEQEVNNTCEEIVKGNLKVSDFPHIRVVYMEGNYFSIDNRRLYIFRVLNVLGSLNHIEVQKVQELNRELTTQNDGCHVTLRRRKINNRWQERDTYRHCACFDGRNANLPRWWNANQKCHVSQMSVLLPNPVNNAKRFPTVYTINPPVNKNFKDNKVHPQHPSIQPQSPDSVPTTSSIRNATDENLSRTNYSFQKDELNVGKNHRHNKYREITKQATISNQPTTSNYTPLHLPTTLHFDEILPQHDQLHQAERKLLDSVRLPPLNNVPRSNLSRKPSVQTPTTPSVEPSVVIRNPSNATIATHVTDVQDDSETHCLSVWKCFRHSLCCCFFNHENN